ncbi:Crp/Fnr family transcriptional regulator [Puniceicoccus vermicola]|uniref:Cyclic nucleotide-binding domain-containing protein n=1 Tax=Puniceicoccus vermicola TaxID=388746 RepID=A0A7X1E3X2_9BACT|nr:cyclic nucleotide-binding domain-containing protein [Puniceicoccus vermicola]MBC2601521.1 cyclic nucleotide-binding domain-containing protein [Puniceicoccus vermicola]
MNPFAPLTDHDLISEILPKVSFLGGLTADQRERIFPRLEVAEFSQGESIAHPGEVPSHVHIIQEGKVDLLISDHGDLISKRQFHVGDCFGEAALLALINETATFVAAENTRLVSLSRAKLLKLHKEEPEIFLHLVLNMARDLARKLQYTDALLLRKKE